MEWLFTRVILNPRETVRRSKARRELTKLRSALIYLAEHEPVYWHQFCVVRLEAESSGDKVLKYEDRIFRFLMDLEEMDDEGLTHTVVDKFIQDAEAGIRQLPDSGNINWDAVHAVDGLRTLWWRNTGENAPARALNPASEFASFLHDGFRFLDIEADPVSAFKRWAAKVGDTEVV